VLLPRIAGLALVVWSAAACSSKDPEPLPQPVPPDADAGSIEAGADDGSADADAAMPVEACSAPMQGDLPCDVADVLMICQNCHQMPPVRGAPFPFLTYEDTQQAYFGDIKRWQRMAQVIEPDDPLHMPPRAATDITQPTDQQLDTLRAWFRACTPPEPEGQGCDKGESHD
jgi:hypothetical protein